MNMLKKMPYWWQLLLMNFGFFGIQHGFSIQFAKMSVIYEQLGAKPDGIPMLWLAAPLTGLFIQPLVGYFSDRTWLGVFGRRRPYFFVGAIFAAIAMVLMPNVKSLAPGSVSNADLLLMAAGLLLVLDASINVCMQPFRAFVADHLPEEQLADGYSMQTFMIGLGGALGFQIAAVDWIKQFPALTAIAPSSLHIQFYMCALIYMAAVTVTVLTTSEKPPPPQSAEDKKASQSASQKGWFNEIINLVKHAPSAMWELSAIQFFTWLGLFCMFIFYTVAVAHSLFSAADYEKGTAIASSSMTVYQLISTGFALILPFLTRKLGNVHVYTGGLLCAAIGLLSVSQVHDPNLLWAPMVGIGLGWAVILSMPYAILAKHLPKERFGLYMGLFNLFVVLPEVLISGFMGPVMKTLLNNNHMMVVTLGGFSMLVAAILTVRLHRFSKTTEQKQSGPQLAKAA